MAHLNLRDRVIETTIAYVGAVDERGVSNLAHVRIHAEKGRAGALEEMTVTGGRRLKLDWRPRDAVKLNDCELAVSLVSGVSDGPDKLMDMLVDADGLVLVLESDPEASEKNELAVSAVREVMARAPTKRFPVVVQVNQTEGALGSPLVETALWKSIDESWPRLDVCIAKGDGVMETLQRAVDGVVESMQGRDDVASPRPIGSPRTEGNPLLGALRQMLVSTVTDQIASMESRLVERIERGGARGEVGNGPRTAAVTEEAARHRQEVDARLASMEAWMERVDVRIASMAKGEGGASRADFEKLGAQLAVEVKHHREAVNVQLASLESWMERLESTLVESSDRAMAAIDKTALRADVERIDSRIAMEATAQRDAVVGEMKEHRKAVRDEVLRAATTASQPLQRTLDALAVEAKKAGAVQAEQAPKNDALRTQIETLVTESRVVVGQIDDIAGQLKKVDGQVDDVTAQMKMVDVQVGRRIAEIRDALKASGEKSDARADALLAELAALTDELRKKKKSWFS